MFVSQLKGRARSREAAQAICQLFYQSITLHNEPGWLRGNCMTNVNDPDEILIFEQWGTRAALDAWRQSSASRFLHDQSAPYLESEWVETDYQE